MSQDAQSFCRDVERKKNILGDITSLVASASPIGLISAALGKLGSHNESVDKSKTMVSNMITQKSVSDVEQICSNAATLQQSNFADKSACFIALDCGASFNDKILASNAPQETIQALIKDNAAKCLALAKGTNNQSNKLSATQSCALNGVLTILSNADLDANTMAILQKSQEATGLLSGSSSKTDRCATVSNKVDASTYSKNYQSCSNTFGLNQTNVALCVGDSTQSNTADGMATCMVGSTSSITTQSKGTASNSDSNVQTQKSSGLTTGMLLVILGIAIVCVFAYLIVTGKIKLPGGSAKKQDMMSSTPPAANYQTPDFSRLPPPPPPFNNLQASGSNFR
jgi:hypothetical protein